MPIQTPFHPRTSALCTSQLWKEWAGYHAVRSYDTSHVREYFAFRHAAGLLDATPLCKYIIRGADAGRFLAYFTVKDVSRLKDGQVTYLCWCDPDGKVLDDGTVTRFAADHYRLTSADPSYAWLLEQATGYDVTIEDVTDEVAALALQGPNARAILAEVCAGDVATLRFFRSLETQVGGHAVEVTRTGYTGDLGYELWMANDGALDVWDALMNAGEAYGIQPAGLDALDVTRIEAGFILGGVDYVSARRALIEHQKSTPREIGLGWCVQLEREPFIGQAALLEERKHGPGWALVGLEIDWDELEALYDAWDLPPDLPAHAWRESIPVYQGVVQVGYATSGSWSPTLKKNLALATLEAKAGKIGTQLAIEWTVEHQRKTVKATVVARPFFDPERKRSTPKAAEVSA